MRTGSLALFALALLALFPLKPAHAANEGDACTAAEADAWQVTGTNPKIKIQCDGTQYRILGKIDESGAATSRIKQVITFGNETDTCSTDLTGTIRYTGGTPPWEYCNGSAWVNFKQPQCGDDDTGECYLDATRSNSDPDFLAANIKTGANVLGVTGTFAGYDTFPGATGTVTGRIAAGPASEDGHHDLSCALKYDGTAWCWGSAYEGGLGVGGATASFLSPAPVYGGASYSSIARHGLCAVKADGTAWCWGSNTYGQVGNNTTTDSSVPVQVVGPGGAGFLTNVSMIATNDYHACALKTDGTVWCWGNNGSGQLGDNTTTDRHAPVQVTGPGGAGFLTNVSEIAVGERVTCAVKTDGTAWCWGSNSYRQLGDNTSTERHAPVQVVGTGGAGFLTGVAGIDTGGLQTCAVKTDGSVWCWGTNWYGSLGDNTWDDHPAPVQVLGPGGAGFLTGVATIRTGYSHACAIKTDGTAWCWGDGSGGILGNNGGDSIVPVQVLGPGGAGFLTNVGDMALGGYHSCAIKTDGNVFCWGYNWFGMVGDGTTTSSYYTPTAVSLGGDCYDDASYECTLTSSRDVADPQFVAANIRDGVTILGITGTLDYQGLIASSVSVGTEHSCAVKADGTAWCWGYNQHGQLGDNTTTDRHAPVQVVGPGGAGFLTNVSAIATGNADTCALKTDGTAWCWGYNWYGRLGDNTTTDRHAPVQVVGPGGAGFLTNVSAIATGNTHTCALKTDGTVWCWGDGYYGAIGDNTTTGRLTPVQVRGPGGVGFLTNVGTIAAGFGHTCAVQTDGTAWCWGYNFNGQLGDNTVTKRLVPVQVRGPGGVGFLTNVSAIATGDIHTCALKTDGTAWCWGYNYYGRLGDNTTTERHTPVQVRGPGGVGFLTNVSEIETGNTHPCAVKTDGTAWCWGNNGAGQLGDNTTTERHTPVQVLGVGGAGFLTNVGTITGGSDHTCAIDTDGITYCWGSNGNGQLGEYSLTDYPTPRKVAAQ